MILVCTGIFLGLLYIIGNRNHQTSDKISNNQSNKTSIPQKSISDSTLHLNLSGIYSTERHSIRITNENGTYIYKSWKNPKALDEGDPDLQLSNGIYTSPENNIHCQGTSKLTFMNGNLTIIIISVTTQNHGCFKSTPPDGAIAYMTIYIDGQEKDHYWMYEITRILSAQQASTTNTVSEKPDDWVHINTRQGNYGNTNYAYVSPSSLDKANNSIEVQEIIEGGARNGQSARYRMEADCSTGMVRTVSNIRWFDTNNNLAGENPPSNPNWHKATGQKDPAVWNYLCRQ